MVYIFSHPTLNTNQKTISSLNTQNIQSPQTEDTTKEEDSFIPEIKLQDKELIKLLYSLILLTMLTNEDSKTLDLSEDEKQEEDQSVFNDTWEFLQKINLNTIPAPLPYRQRLTHHKSYNCSGAFTSTIRRIGKRANLDPIFKRYGPTIDKAAKKYNVDRKLIASVIYAESRGNPNAASRCRAQGLMQLMPSTARSLGVNNAFDADQNIMGGTKYLRGLLDRFNGNISFAVAGYNAGPGAVKKYGGIPPYRETKNYVSKILANMSNYTEKYFNSGTGELTLPVNGRLTCNFGPREHPITGRHSFHTGVDLGAKWGTKVKAADSGIITFAGWKKAYGNFIVINHGSGRETRYGHLSSINVYPSQKVSKGEHIGNVGSTGLSTGPHLHFEIRKNGIALNPLNHLHTA